MKLAIDRKVKTCYFPTGILIRFFKKSWTFFSFETLLEFWCHLQKQMEAEILGRLQKFLKNSDRESIHY